MRSRVMLAGLLAAVCGGGIVADAAPQAPDVASLQVVDCLLPGQVRRLGTRVTYLSARRPARLPARECEVRGGEYVAYDRADYRSALKVWEEQATQGDAKAQTYVGEIYEKGLGVPPDYAVAAVWYRKAADQGDARAQVNLGHLYEAGLGVDRDPQAALRWYAAAAGGKANVALEPATAGPAPDPGAAALRQQLAQTEQQLAAAREQLQAATAALQAERDRNRQAAENGGATKAQLAAREAELARQQQEMARLQAQTRDLSARLAAAQTKPPEPAAPAVPVAGPTVTLIEPPLLRTRGAPELPVAPDTARDFVGRVTAPAGLLSFNVDGRPQDTDANGLFRVKVPVARERQSVTLVAVDRQGERVQLDVVLVPRLVAPVQPTPAARPPVDFGRFHALVIGVDTYKHPQMRSLKTAVSDAEAVAGTLGKRYGFNVKVLRNATRYEILSALAGYFDTLGEEDNFLLYYAGHGTLQEGGPVTRGYWQPADAEPGSPANWISSVEITDQIGALRAKQVLVIADSCYSGALTRSAMARTPEQSPAERDNWLKLMARKRSRTALTSGGLAPVLDTGSGGHSVFAAALLDVLQTNQDVLEAQRLYREVSARVALAAERYRMEQVPEYAPIGTAGHEAGDFFFVPAAQSARADAPRMAAR